jgi:hypothetical protein
MKTLLLGWVTSAVFFSFLGFTYQTRSARPPVKEPHISVADADLTLGMSKADVMKVIPDRYEVRKNETKGIDWLIAEKDHPNGPFVALAFHEGKLTQVIKPWLAEGARSSNEGVEVGRAIYGIIATFIDQGDTACVLRLDHTDTPTISAKSATIRCGQHDLSVGVAAQAGAGETVQVQESLDP